MLHVLAFTATKPGMRDAVLREFRANMPAVRAEESCIKYDPVIDVPTFGPFQAEIGPNPFVVVEKQVTTEGLNAHAASPHMKPETVRAADMIQKRVIHAHSPI